MALSAVPRLPTGPAAENINKSYDLGAKLPRGLLLMHEDSLTFTPRPIKAAAVLHHEGSHSPSDPSSPSTSENSFVSGSIVSFNGNQWASRSPPASSTPVHTKNVSPFASQSYTRGLLVALVEQTLSGGEDKISQSIRRVCSAPVLASVPEEQASLAALRSTFAGRTSLATDVSTQLTVPTAPAPAPVHRELKQSLSAPAKSNNVIRGMVVTPSQQELDALFPDQEDTVVCEIRIPGLDGAAGLSLARIQTTLVFEEEWDLPLEQFPFSPKPGSAPMPALEEDMCASASCGLLALFKRANSKK